MRRLTSARMVLALLACLMGLAALYAAPAGAQTDDSSDSDGGSDDGVEGSEMAIDVIEVSGLIDRVIVDFVVGTLDDIDSDPDSDSLAVIIQLNSPGVVASDGDYARLLERIEMAKLPVGIWVGPSGASVEDDAIRLALAGDLSGISGGSSLKAGTSFDALPPEYQGADIDADEAVKMEGSDFVDAPTLRNFVVEMEEAGLIQNVSREVDTGRELTTTVRFAKLPLPSQLMHTVASPPVAYLLLLIGLVLIVFDFFTASIGIAGAVGAVSLLLSAYGLDVLPVRGLGLVLLVASILAFSIDVQVGIPRFWSAVGTVGLVLGSFMLYDGQSLPWVTLLAGVVGTLLMMIGGIPAMIRTRFSTPTIGREWMVGELADVVTAVDPDGVIELAGAKWRAHTNRATPLGVGSRARVVAIEGVIVQVEPEEGGARDYRDRSGDRKRASTAASADPGGDGGDSGDSGVVVS